MMLTTTDVKAIGDKVRAIDHLDWMAKIERELRREGDDKVLLVPGPERGQESPGTVLVTSGTSRRRLLTPRGRAARSVGSVVAGRATRKVGDAPAATPDPFRAVAEEESGVAGERGLPRGNAPTTTPDPLPHAVPQRVTTRKARLCVREIGPCARKSELRAREAGLSVRKAEVCVRKVESRVRKVEVCARKAGPRVREAELCARKVGCGARAVSLFQPRRKWLDPPRLYRVAAAVSSRTP